MANRGRPTQTKRQRERARQERARMKEARRAESKARREASPGKPGDRDADLEGIVPGPQDPPDWQREFFEEEQRAKEAAELEAKNRE